MSDLQRRPGGSLTRSQRERRAYRLIVTGGVTGALGLIGLVLAAVGVVGAGLPILLLIVAAVCAWLTRRTLGS